MSITSEELLELYNIIAERNEFYKKRNSIRFRRYRITCIHKALIEGRNTIRKHGKEKLPKKYKNMPRGKVRQSVLELNHKYTEVILQISYFTERTSERLRELLKEHGAKLIRDRVENRINGIRFDNNRMMINEILKDRQKLITDIVFEEEILRG